MQIVKNVNSFCYMDKNHYLCVRNLKTDMDMKREIKVTKALPLSELEKSKLASNFELMLQDANLPIKFRFSHIEDCKGTCIFDENTFNVTFACKNEKFVNLFGYDINIHAIRFYVQKCFGLEKQTDLSYKYSNKPIYRLFIEVDGSEKGIGEREKRIMLKDNLQEMDNLSDFCVHTALLDLKRRLTCL